MQSFFRNPLIKFVFFHDFFKEFFKVFFTIVWEIFHLFLEIFWRILNFFAIDLLMAFVFFLVFFWCISHLNKKPLTNSRLTNDALTNFASYKRYFDEFCSLQTILWRILLLTNGTLWNFAFHKQSSDEFRVLPAILWRISRLTTILWRILRLTSNRLAKLAKKFLRPTDEFDFYGDNFRNFCLIYIVNMIS